jgi:FkbM family methyltransferase
MGRHALAAAYTAAQKVIPGNAVPSKLNPTSPRRRPFMMRDFLRSSLRQFGYEITQYPLPDWYLLRSGLTELFDQLQINCAIDVGANKGQFASFLRQIGYKGRIVSFEPVSTTFQLLKETSKNDHDWRVQNLAVGSADETLEINITGGSAFNSLLPMNSYGKTQFPKESVVRSTEKVNVVRLDSIMGEILQGLEKPRIYLKMDTQGYDLQVLEGASTSLPLILGLQSEIALKPIYEGMPDYLTSLAKLNDLGFSVTSLVPVTRDEKLRVVEFDCLMVRTRLN